MRNPFIRHTSDVAVEERAFRPFNPAGQMLPAEWTNAFWQWGGAEPVTATTAASIPAVTSAVRLIAETVATLPLYVYRGEMADKRRADSSQQQQLLDAPNPESNRYTFFCDVAACIEWTGNCLIQKVRLNGRVVEMYVLDPNYVQIFRDPQTGEKVYQASDGATIRRLDPNDVIHIRGFSHVGGIVGVSPIAMFRDPLGAELAASRFAGRFFANDARPGVVLSYPATVGREQAREWTQEWNANHAGVENAHKTATLGGGAEVKTIPISMDDAQFVAQREFNSKQIARMFRVPAALLDIDMATARQTNEQISLNFLNYSLLPRLTSISSAFRADLDLFGGTDMYPEFFLDEFLRADANTRASVLHNLVQSGILLVDEARAQLGLPPLPDGAGQVPQLTPVGGAPNPAPDPAPMPASDMPSGMND